MGRAKLSKSTENPNLKSKLTYTWETCETQINLTSSNFLSTHPIKNEFLLGFAAQKFGISLA